MNADSLLEAVPRLFDLFREREVSYVLVGGLALLNYVEGRNTEDIDVIMALSSLRKLPEIEVVSQDEFFARGRYGELMLDVLLTRNPLFETVQRKYATKQHFVEQEIPCATVEGLLLLKLYALPSLYRLGDFARVGIYENDIATLIHYQIFSNGSNDLNSVHEIRRRGKNVFRSSVAQLRRQVHQHQTR